MKIYNTLTRQKEEFIPINKGKVKMYICGPTTYNYIHVGNARPLCIFDTVRRYFEYRNYEVTFVQNYTDIDDKIINRAVEQGVDPSEFANKFIKEFETDSSALSVRPATIHPKVSENIPEIVEFIKTLIDKGFAYVVDGDVYFRTHKFEEYGKLSHMPLDDLEAGVRIDVSSIKENPMDFALWKAAKPNEPSWEAPWGNGRPGWHIECSAMIKKYMGDTIDIHCGGQDLVFPHHENEIAQSECANGCAFANYWMHNGYINVDNKKMSKSAGVMFSARDVGKKYGYDAIRMLSIQAHYRNQVNYTTEVIEACKASVDRLANCKDALTRAIASSVTSQESSNFNEKMVVLNKFKDDFIIAMDDDFNTADALSAIYEMVREINTELASATPVSKEYLVLALELFNEVCSILGLLQNDNEDEIPAEILDLVEQRKVARANKDFSLADEIRDSILAMGYAVEETRQGLNIKKLN